MWLLSAQLLFPQPGLPATFLIEAMLSLRIREQPGLWFWFDRLVSDVLLDLRRDLLFRFLEFLRMHLAPFRPECLHKCLENARQRRGQQRAPDAEEFSARDQCHNRDGGMQPDRFTDDARSDNVALNHMHDDEVGQHDDSQDPPWGGFLSTCIPWLSKLTKRGPFPFCGEDASFARLSSFMFVLLCSFRKVRCIKQ